MMTRQPIHSPDTWGWTDYAIADIPGEARPWWCFVNFANRDQALFKFATRGERKRLIDGLRQERREYEAEQAIRAQAREVMALAAERRGYTR